MPARLIASLGIMSYSLYLVHMPFLTLVNFCFGATTSGLAMVSKLATSLAGSVFVGFLLFYIVERRFLFTIKHLVRDKTETDYILKSKSPSEPDRS